MKNQSIIIVDGYIFSSIIIYIVYAINEWIVATVAHCKPITEKPYDVNVFVFVDIGPGDV